MRPETETAAGHSRTEAFLAMIDIQPSESLAYTDDLTGLPNRRFLDRALDMLLARGCPFSLFFLDLDNFKAVNDLRGHAEGDRVIQRFADLLNSSIRGDDLLARYGGDEFIVLVNGGDSTTAAAIAARIVSSATATLKPLWSVTASLGVARFPEDARSKHALLTLADRAMYAAKDGGKSCWRRAGSEDRTLFWHEDVFIGREDEMAVLATRLTPGNRNAFTFVTGETGMGKATLIQRALLGIPATVNLLDIRCTPELSAIPYAPLVAALRTGCSRYGRPQLPPAWTRVLSTVLPDLFPSGEPVAHPFERVAVLQAVSSLLSAWHPLVVVVRDGHQVDRETAEALVYLYQVGMPDHLAMCCSLSGTRVHGRKGNAGLLTGLADAVTLDLRPLRRDQIRELVCRRLGAQNVSDELVDGIQRASGGMPLIANDMVRGLLESGALLHEGEGSPVSDAIPALASGRIAGMVGEKLAALSDDERLVILQAATAEGRFDADLLKRLTGQSEGEVLTALDRSRRLGLLTEESGDPFAFTFVNEVFRGEVLRAADMASRRQAHLRMAGHLQPTEQHAARARHLEHGGECLEAVRAYIQAARQSAAKLLPQVALHHLSQAERLRARMPPDSLPFAEVEALWGGLASLFYHCDLPEESRDIHGRLAEACEARGDVRSAQYHRYRSAVMHRIMGQLDRALRELEPLRLAADPELRVQVLLEEVDCLSRLGRPTEVMERLRRVRTVLRTNSEIDRGLRRRYDHARTLAAIGRGAFRTAERAAMSAIRGLEDNPEIWWYYNDVAETCMFNGKPQAALRHLAHGQRLAAMVPSILGEIWTRLGLANADYYLARPVSALKTLEETEPLIRKAGDSAALLAALLHRARISLDLDDAEAAREALQAARQSAPRHAATAFVSSLIEYAGGNWPEALELIDAALEAAGSSTTPLQLQSGILLTRVDLEVHREAILLARGDVAGVRQRLTPHARSFYPRARLRALGLLAECAHRDGDDNEAAALYREALKSSVGRQELRERRLLQEAWAAWSPEAEQFRGREGRSRLPR